MDRMDAVRKVSPPLPEWCFQQARKKIKGGNYDFDADQRSGKHVAIKTKEAQPGDRQ